MTSNPTRRAWTDAEDATLRTLYEQLSAGAIAEILGRTKASVKMRINTLGITKSDNRGCFLKGNAPWNKGLHYMPGGRCIDTQFKKGRPAHESRNYVPIGTLRISKDGYLERKTTDDPSIYPARRWSFVHRLVWIEANGPVPAGHLIVFKKGMRTNTLDEITPDRLECISLAENMRRNTFHNYGPEVAKAVQLRGAITRQINKREGKKAA